MGERLRDRNVVGAFLGIDEKDGCFLVLATLLEVCRVNTFKHDEI